MTAVLGRQIGAPTPVPAPPGALNFINVLANYPGPTHDLKKKPLHLQVRNKCEWTYRYWRYWPVTSWLWSVNFRHWPVTSWLWPVNFRYWPVISWLWPVNFRDTGLSGPTTSDADSSTAKFLYPDNFFGGLAFVCPSACVLTAVMEVDKSDATPTLNVLTLTQKLINFFFKMIQIQALNTDWNILLRK